ncbi:AAA family ATPase [Microseira sp. BLCC-F43]|uniref:ATP-binding protein n=1 Tax=Microseira sp. BLCC-F43 TaxID=3153602 RepID=UPI0035BB2D99
MPAIGNPENLEGTLAYISPEQTGRMNRAVDYRTDFYSLGATFYQMLTGKLPFTTSDALELVHCHIAKNPVPPHQVCAEIPIAVSDIVMKLMAKTAEDRYQSALGLKHDLEICLHQLESNGEIAHFTPGKLDKSGQFLITQKLYGRVNEVRNLLEAFDRVSAGSSELMLVSGYSGIGKTSVVNEVHKAIVQQRGYFIAGKFDQLKRNIPYAALIQACQTMLEQLLTETDEEIERWKQALLAALEQNGQAIVDVIPEVEHIIGSQPSIPQLDAAATQNRFNRVFQQFIGVLAKEEHPLVVFLDDLQWADSASLKLIQNILCDGDTHHLLLIGAYRDNEVSPTHPTVITIKNIQQAGAVVNQIVLQPLSLAHASELICDTLGESLKFEGSSSPDGLGVRMRSLMRLAYNKTQGNPFFLTQLLQTLHSEQLLHFDFDRGEWTWELEQIQAVGITDINVVELVARNIQRLSEETQQFLKLAACMGNQFNLDTLTIISEKSIINTADKLWDALEAGLILPLSQAYKIPMFVDDAEQQKWQFDALGVTYKFLHDRIQQAAYSLIPDEDKKTTHLKIGQLLLQKTPESAIEDNIFDIVNQLNIGVELITNSAEKEQLAALNLIAGRKAKAATAYEAAVRYLSVGLGLLTASSWQSNYDITLNLHVEAVEAEYITTPIAQNTWQISF